MELGLGSNPQNPSIRLSSGSIQRRLSLMVAIALSTTGVSALRICWTKLPWRGVPDLVSLDELFPDLESAERQHGSGRQPNRPHSEHWSGLAHHSSLWVGPVLGRGQGPDADPLRDRGQVTVFRLGVPQRGAFGQPQFGAAAARFALLAASASRGASGRGNRG